MQTDHLKEEKIELRVLSWLSEKGFQLIRRNWAYCHHNIDIIASRFGELHFIGLARKAYLSGENTEEGVTRRKMLSFLQASQQYMKRNPQWQNVMIDVLTVMLVNEEPGDCLLERNVKI